MMFARNASRSRWLLLVILMISSPSLFAKEQQQFELWQLFNTEPAKPVRMLVMDFTNLSGFQEKTLGPAFADALSAVLATGAHPFEISRVAVPEQAVLSDPEQLAQLADLLKVPFVLTGTINKVKLYSGGNDPSSLEVEAVVISRNTRQPICGVRLRIDAALAPAHPVSLIRHSAGTLVELKPHHVLKTTVNQLAKKLAACRMPISMVLTSPTRFAVIISGGSNIGLHTGQYLTTIRRESVTGRLRLLEVAKDESEGEILADSRGIAPGDTAIPEYNLQDDVLVTLPE